MKIAVQECKGLGYLSEFFANFKIEELVDMVNLEYNPELERRVLLEEGREDGLENVAINLLNNGMPIEEVFSVSGISIERLHELKNNKPIIITTPCTVKPCPAEMCDAVEMAVQECKRQGYLAEFFSKYKIEELVEMVSLEFDPELERVAIFEEGLVNGLEEAAIKLIKKGMPIDEVFSITSVSVEHLNELRKHKSNH